jgi:hypothetical protein
MLTSTIIQVIGLSVLSLGVGVIGVSLVILGIAIERSK